MEKPVEPEMMFAEARLMSASEDEAPTPNLQPPALKSRLAASPVAVVVVSVLLLIVAFLAVLFTIARVVTATASPG